MRKWWLICLAVFVPLLLFFAAALVGCCEPQPDPTAVQIARSTP